jgi:hypothetical protein
MYAFRLCRALSGIGMMVVIAFSRYFKRTAVPDEHGCRSTFAAVSVIDLTIE